MADFYASILEMPFLSDDYCFPFDITTPLSAPKSTPAISVSTPASSSPSNTSYSFYSTSSPQDILMSMPEISQGSLLTFDTPAPAQQNFTPPSPTATDSSMAVSTPPLPLESDFCGNGSQSNNISSADESSPWMMPTRQTPFQMGLTQFQEYQLQQDPDIFSVFGPSPASYLTAATQALTGNFSNPTAQTMVVPVQQQQQQSLASRQVPQLSLPMQPKVPQEGMISPPETPSSTPSPVCLKPLASPSQYTRQMSPLSPAAHPAASDFGFFGSYHPDSESPRYAMPFGTPQSPVSPAPHSSASATSMLPEHSQLIKRQVALSFKSPKVSKPRKPSRAAIKAAAGMGVRCANCGATVTPLWRRSANNEPLCNACGLYHKLHAMHRPKHLQQSMGHAQGAGGHKSKYGPKSSLEHSSSESMTGSSDSNFAGSHASSPNPQPTCSNCKTTLTPLWRKDDAGDILCNACGLYYKLHHIHRPISLKRNVIRRRSRYENGKSASSSSSLAKSQAFLQAQAQIQAQGQSQAQAQSTLVHVAAAQARLPVQNQVYSQQTHAYMQPGAMAFGVHPNPSMVAPSVRMHPYYQQY